MPQGLHGAASVGFERTGLSDWAPNRSDCLGLAPDGGGALLVPRDLGPESHGPSWDVSQCTERTGMVSYLA